MHSKLSEKLAIGLILFLITATIACKKRPELPRAPGQVIGKLSKIEYGNGSYDSMFYNNDLSLHSIKKQETSPDNRTTVFLFEYDTDKRLTRLSLDNGEYYTYHYSSGQLLSAAHYVSGVKQDYRIYTYADKLLTSFETFVRINPVIAGYAYTSKRELLYYPDGNIKAEVNYDFDSLQLKLNKTFTISYSQYDDKQNPLDELSRVLYQPNIKMAVNNHGKQHTKEESSGAIAAFDHEYTYNDFSNPVTRKTSYLYKGQLIQESARYYYY